MIRRLVPDDGGYDLQHLRRFAKFSDVPGHTRTSISEARSKLFPSSKEDGSQQLLLIVGATQCISQEALYEGLSSFVDHLFFCSTKVPLLAPTSPEQAAEWTAKYWPTVYKKSNPFGPHPSIVSRAEEEMRGDVSKWMGLAEEVARKSSSSGIGEAVGVVVIERRNGIARPVAVAGDARWIGWPRGKSGNVTAHAALRAIAMVSEGLKVREEAEQGMPPTVVEDQIFRDKPLPGLEEDHYAACSEDGYLCHDLEIYCTHEPCVMCSMAIVHSRFGRIVFQTRLPPTGGICADGELGHGLFWRKELNWSMLAWQWLPLKDTSDLPQYISSEDFNA